MHSVLTQLSYLDAGTGSIIVQAVVGVVAGIGLFARRKIAPVVYKIKSVFSKKSVDSVKADED